MPSSVAHSFTPPPVPASVRALGRRVSWDGSYAGDDIETRLFELRREATALSTRDEPLARVSALLLSIASNNSYEGRDPTVIPETLSSGFVADLLGITVDDLSYYLSELEARGLIQSGGSSTLRLKNMNALAELAEQG